MNLHATLMNNEYIDRKKKSYSRMATNVEWMKELESYQLAAIIMIVNSGKKHQWMLELVDKNLMRERILVSEYLPIK